MGELLIFAINNPSMLKEEDFLASFVARQDLAEQLLGRLREITLADLATHHLILGQRGMGKTSLLRRLALGVRDDPALSAVLLPLTFREEQYNVHNFHVFWCNCLDALGDWFEANGQTDKAEAIDKASAALSRGEADPDGGAALEVFKRWAKREGKRPLLLLDNIDIILNGLKRDQWSLRRILQEAGGIVVVGASATLLEATDDPKAAFYDFFQVTVLEKLRPDELLICLRRLAQARGDEGQKVLTAISGEPGRVRALHDLTGGNPRTLILLYLLLELDAEGDVLSDLDRLLDQVTVLYKARVEDLSPQARVVLDAVALAWNPIIAADIAAATGLETSTASAQLDRLGKDGVVEKVSVSTTSRAAYQLSERFFNIWYLMRHGPRRQRTRLRWLTGFLRQFYTTKQLTEKAKSLLKLENHHGPERGHYYLALSDAMADPGWRNLLGYEARIEFERGGGRGTRSREEFVNPSELPTPQTAKEWLVHAGLLEDHLERYDDAEAAYRKAIELDPERAVPWDNLGDLLSIHLKRYEEAEAVYRKAAELDPNYAWPWNGLGILLQYHLERYKEAESAYRKATELDPELAPPWVNLGNLLQYRLERYEEAEAAYRKAIELDPELAPPWNNLGNLQQNHLKRYEEAEAAYRKAIELDLNRASPWNNLGNLMQDHLERYEEAEAAYRKAIELDLKYAPPWNGLGALLQDHLERYEEAEAAYRKAIEFDPKLAQPWNNLGNLLRYRLERYEEAEAAYRKAIELDPKHAWPWINLGTLLQNNLSRFEEAEAAYRRATEIDPINSKSWAALGYVRFYFLGQYDEAVAAYEEALKLEPEDLIIQSNLLALHLAQSQVGDEVDEEFDAVTANHPAHGVALFRAIRAVTRDNFGEAAKAFETALSADQSDVFDTYQGFILLFLRLAAARGYGDKLIDWLDERGLSERYWPLYSAYDAYLHGEARLMDVNPEVRGAAKRIFEWLGSPKAIEQSQVA